MSYKTSEHRLARRLSGKGTCHATLKELESHPRTHGRSRESASDLCPLFLWIAAGEILPFLLSDQARWLMRGTLAL